MANFVYTAGLLLAAVIHLLPLAGVLGAERLATLYGVAIDDPNLVLLMRHRAVLFGVLGVALAMAAFRPAFAVPALAAGLVSAGSFLVLAPASAALTPAIQRVVIADWIALAALGTAGVASFWLQR